MKIALINGSPKVKSSASGILLEDLKVYLGETEVMEFGFHTGAVTGEEVEALNQADALVFSFPLYVDGIPGHLLSCLADAICAGQTLENQQTQEIQRAQENQYVSVAFPRFLYKLAAQTGWRQMMKANGGRVRDLGKKPEISKE